MPENTTPKQQGGFKSGQSGNAAESGKENPNACERRKPGRPPHRPTAYWRGQVDAYASYGTPHASIAKVIGIDEKTLRKHYASELDVAAINWKSDVCAGLDAKYVARVLADRGMLAKAGDGNLKVEKIAGTPKRVYVVTPRIFDGSDA
jgi:hypothetical protein